MFATLYFFAFKCMQAHGAICSAPPLNCFFTAGFNFTAASRAKARGFPRGLAPALCCTIGNREEGLLSVDNAVIGCDGRAAATAGKI
jgi:hypothetical protein